VFVLPQEVRPSASTYRLNGLDPQVKANFWQNGFLMTSPLEGESENRRVYEWWAWVDLNHQPRPYQYCGHY
jgi:hypothetical protein